MSIRNDITIDWEVSPRIIEISKDGDSPTEVTIQDLYDTLRILASQESAMDDDDIVSGSGKEVLGVSVMVGLTITLLNAKVKFEDRVSPPWIVCDVTGGNLVALDENGEPMNPIEPSSYITVTKTSSSSATLVNLEETQGGLTEEEHNKLMTMAFDIDFIKSIQSGRWKIVSNQMIFYKEDNITELMRFNLFNANGQPAETNVMERQRV